MEQEMKRVSYFDLDRSPYGGDVTLDEEPYSGIAFIERDGSLDSEMTYFDGVLHGVSRAWSGGELSREAHFVAGMSHGIARDYYDEGPLWRETLCSFGVRLHEREFALDGTLVRDERFELGEFERNTMAMGRAAHPDAPEVGESLPG